MPFQQVKKINASGYVGVFLQKMEYSDLILILLLIILLKDIYVYMIDKKNRYFVLVFSVIIISWILSAIHSGIFVSLLDALGMVMLISLFIVVAILSRDKENFIVINKVNFLTAVAVSVFGMAVILIDKIIPIPLFDILFLKKYDGNAAVFMDRYCFLMKSPEMLITYLTVALVSGFIVCEFDKRKGYYLFLILIISAAVSALSRGLSGLFIASALMFLCKYRDDIKYSVVSRVLVVFSVIFLLFTIILSVYKFEKIDPSDSKSFVSIYWAYDMRIPMGIAAIDIFKDYPVIGAGPGNYTKLAKNYIKKTGYNDQDYLSEFTVDPHNVYLGLLAENGLLGFMSFVLLFYGLFVSGGKNYLGVSTKLHYRYNDYMHAGIIGLLATGLFVDILSLRHFWILMAMLSSSFLHTELNDNPGSQCAHVL